MRYPRPIVWLIATAAILSLPTIAEAQGTRADYDRAGNLRNLTRDKVFRDRVDANWSADGRHLWYKVRTGPDQFEYVFVDTEKGTRRVAFDHPRLAASLKDAGDNNATADDLGIDQLIFDTAKNTIGFRNRGRHWLCNLDDYKLTENTKIPKAPDGRRLTPTAVSRAPRASDNSDQQSEIVFFNQTENENELVWRDFDGHPRSYGKLAPGEKRAQHTYAGHTWIITGDNDRPFVAFVAASESRVAVIDGRPVAEPPQPRRRRWRGRGEDRRRSSATSPDGNWRIVIEDYNVHLRDIKTDEQTALTTDGTEDHYYRDRAYWSPDSKKVVVIRTKSGDERKVYYVESAPRDQVQPKLHSYEYLKPGDRVAIDTPALFDVAEKKRIPVSDDLFKNPWRNSSPRWAPDSSRFTFLFNQRGHQVLRIIAVDAKTGKASALINEQAETFIDYSRKSYSRYLDDTNEIIWMSERDGWNHLYLYDSKTGEVKNQITQGEWVVRDVERIDTDKRQIWFTAGGIHPRQNPYYLHHCRINFEGTGLVVMTESHGTHEIDYSPDRRFIIARWSRVDQPTVTELRRVSDGKLVCELERADFSALTATGWRAPERFVAKGRDGKTDIYGIIHRPTNFDPKKKYPVIEKIYAGPHGSHVPRRFSNLHSAQEMAELGFIVVQIDGMGTSHRSKAFHDVCWKNIGDAGFPDRILWMKAAAKNEPAMDLSRVGIYGGSAGGQNALRALLAHGDFYKVAAADCGCHDNRMDKIWWNEAWMGWPINDHYKEQSNVTQAHKLQGKLLLTVGEKDENVDPASTMQVVDALIEADKDFELIVFPGRGHGAGESAYGKRRRADFFVRHLLGVEPRQQ